MPDVELVTLGAAIRQGLISVGVPMDDLIPDAYDLGVVSSGLLQPAVANGLKQRAVNNGSHVLAPFPENRSLILHYANGATAGTVTPSGFTNVFNGANLMDLTPGNEFLLRITTTNGSSILEVFELQ